MNNQSINEVASLFDALSKFQATCPVSDKSGYNPHFKSAYANMVDITKLVAKAAEFGLSVVTMPTKSEEPGAIDITGYLCHKDGGYLHCTFTLTPTKRDPQGIGSALSYGRRYCTQMLLGIASDEDDDGEAASVGTVTTKAPKEIDWDAKIKGCKTDDDYRKLWSQATRHIFDEEKRALVHDKITKARGG